MRKILIGVGVALAAVVVDGQGLLGQSNDNPFRVRNERGQLVHVLPTPARVHNASDKNQLVAPPSDSLQVFRGSYGYGNLIDHGGAEMSGMAVQPVFWTKALESDTNTSTTTSTHYPTLQAQIEAFFGSYGANLNNYTQNNLSADYPIIQQYGSSNPIAPGFNHFSSIFASQTPAPSTVDDSTIQTYLTSQTGLSSNVIYAIYFPPGTQVTLSNSASCTSFCGYHNTATGAGGQQIHYAVFPYPNCTGCSLGSPFTVADMLTIVSSHETRESVTDPGDNGINAWYDLFGYEADDKCAWHNLYQMTNGGFWVQPEYSNGGFVTRSNVQASFPGPGCVVPNSSGPTQHHHR